MNIIDLIDKKNLRRQLEYSELKYVVDGYLNHGIDDLNMTLFLKSICNNDMNEEEIFSLTDIILNSGNKIDLSSISGIKVDKHSTGGVGDKTTLIVGPMVASCGVVFPKMSGRGLGFTGGTIDKLESISGFKTNLSTEDFIKELIDINISIISQTENIVPADKKIYALRDVTGTTESIPLIASSIMSKKLACGADKIFLDVKYGVGALMKTKEDAIKLAKIMVSIGNKYNKETVAILTNMDYPLGFNIGNGLEVKEAIDILNNKGNTDLKDLCLVMASLIVSMSKNITFDAAKVLVINNLNNGNAYKKFVELINYQGGDINNISISKNIIEVVSKKDGYINNIDALKIGILVNNLGAGRTKKDDLIDYGVGIELLKQVGDKVIIGDILAKVYLGNKIIDESNIMEAFLIEETLNKKEPTILGIIK